MPGVVKLEDLLQGTSKGSSLLECKSQDEMMGEEAGEKDRCQKKPPGLACQTK